MINVAIIAHIFGRRLFKPHQWNVGYSVNFLSHDPKAGQVDFLAHSPRLAVGGVLVELSELDRIKMATSLLGMTTALPVVRRNDWRPSKQEAFVPSSVALAMQSRRPIDQGSLVCHLRFTSLRCQASPGGGEGERTWSVGGRVLSGK
ncbi:unnamed protein product [Protopolystoma xenopodis]|uniref:Uncharacterized protein n=1 Tax=Protopolystoma xenopodis TaxID=117903 RepID=A0A3S5B6M0_9PLAT|nr:unnamed protein product [Protopolystoma xenopodis]